MLYTVDNKFGYKQKQMEFYTNYFKIYGYFIYFLSGFISDWFGQNFLLQSIQ
jgi:hypothetical protein